MIVAAGASPARTEVYHPMRPGLRQRRLKSPGHTPVGSGDTMDKPQVVRHGIPQEAGTPGLIFYLEKVQPSHNLLHRTNKKPSD